MSRRLIRVLPHLLVLTARDWATPLVPLLAEEIVKDEPVRRPCSTGCWTCC